MTTHYSTAQKIAMAGIVLGAIMCAVGAFAPYWMRVSLDIFPQGPTGTVSNVIKQILPLQTELTGSGGLYAQCTDEFDYLQIEVTQLCEFLPFQSTSGWYHSARAGAALCVILGGLSGIIALCLACCNCCKQLIALGILAFLAAATGAFTAIVFARNTDVFAMPIPLPIPLTVQIPFFQYQMTSFGWAFYVFCVGDGILGLVSFLACFATSENQVHHGVLSQPANPIVITTATMQHQPPYMYPQPPGPIGMVNPSADP